jgi:hypothetical protein
MEGFAIDDSEVPDLVLETIIGFLAAAIPTEQWSAAICSVSRRWRRVARPVLREAFLAAWPRFTIPRTGEADKLLSVDAGRTVVSLASTEDKGYPWRFVQPLRLCDVVAADKPVTVWWLPDHDGGGVYFAAWLVSSRENAIFDDEVVWEPTHPMIEAHCGNGVCCSALGGYSGDTCGVLLDGTQCEQIDGEVIADPDPVYSVTYTPGGKVAFFVDGKPHSTCWMQEAEMLALHDSTALLVFGVAIDSFHSVTISATEIPKPV